MSEHQEYKGFLQKRQLLEEIIKDQLVLLKYLNMKG